MEWFGILRERVDRHGKRQLIGVIGDLKFVGFLDPNEAARDNEGRPVWRFYTQSLCRPSPPSSRLTAESQPPGPRAIGEASISSPAKRAREAGP